MGNKMKKLICSLLATAMLVGSLGAVAFAAPDDETTEAETAVTATAEDASTADQTDEEKEATDDTTAAEATEAPAAEATAEPAAEATEAPAAETATTTTTGTSFDNDNYYTKALALCSSLGIISGYEDGSVRPDSNVTRAEMASIVLRMLKISSSAKYQNIFTDVDASHWAADQIQTAYEAGIVSGMGDGTFQPDGQVTYAQVIVMLVNALNYQTDAEYYGGWQDGYLKIAGSSDLNLIKNAPGYADVASDRGTVIKMVYNSLLADYKEIKTTENGIPKYEAYRTLAEAKFDVIEKKGILVGTAKTTTGSNDIQEGEIEVQADDSTTSEVFDTTLTGLEDYLAQKITYYYRTRTGQASEIVAVSADSTKSETYMIEDPDDIESIKGFETGNGQIKVQGVSKVRNCKGAKIIYNGKLMTYYGDDNDYDTAKAAAKATEQARFGDSVNDFIKPEMGTIKLVKSDTSSDIYDIIFVDSYDTVIVSSATNEKLNGQIAAPAANATTAKDISNKVSYTINLDDSVDRTVTVTKKGQEIRLRNLKKNDVASVKRSIDDTVVDIVAPDESIIGIASGVTVKLDDSRATVNGEKYDVANIAVGDLKSGSQSTFYFDMFGRIAYIESSTSGRLASGEKYGWLMSTYKSESGDDQIVQIMTQDGKAEELKFASSVDYWAPNQTTIGATSRKAEWMETEVQRLVDEDDFPHMWESTRITSRYVVSGDASSGRPYEWNKKYALRLVKYKTNSSGKITLFYGAVNFVNQAEYYYNASDPHVNGGKNITDPYVDEATAEALKSSNALLIDVTNKSGSLLQGGMVGGYVITDDIKEFGVPKLQSKFNDAGAYAVANVNSSKYNLRENGLSDDYVIGDPDGTAPGAIIRFIDDADEPVNPADIDTVANISAMVVDSFDVEYDEDDNEIYVINGYAGGSETSVRTNKTSALGKFGNGYNDKKYALDTTEGKEDPKSTSTPKAKTGILWTAKDSAPLTDFLKKGDIIVSDGTYIMLYMRASEIYDNALDGISKNVVGSETRNFFWFDRVTNSGSDSTDWMTVGGNTLSADAGMGFDLIEVDLSVDNTDNKAITLTEDVESITSVEPYSATADEYDYAFVRFASKGVLQQGMIYRIKNVDKALANQTSSEEEAE